MTNPYDTLGVDKDATPDEIKKAYRDKSKQHHPDKEGGDEDKFKEVSAAMAIIGHPEKRKRYDETGETKVDSFETKFQQFIAGGLASMERIDEDKIEHFDLMGMFKSAVRESKKGLISSRKNIESQIKKYSKAVKRIKRKDGNLDRNIIYHLMNSKVIALEKSLIKCNTEIEFVDKVAAVLNDYEFEFTVEVAEDRWQPLGASILHEEFKTTQEYRDLMDQLRKG